MLQVDLMPHSGQEKTLPLHMRRKFPFSRYPASRSVRICQKMVALTSSAQNVCLASLPLRQFTITCYRKIIGRTLYINLTIFLVSFSLLKVPLSFAQNVRQARKWAWRKYISEDVARGMAGEGGLRTNTLDVMHLRRRLLKHTLLLRVK